MLPFFPVPDGMTGDGPKIAQTSNNWSLGNAAAGMAGVGLGSIVSGYLGAEAQRETNEMTEKNFQEQLQQQERFAKEGIQWRVEDARKAGISPLAALGASGAQYSPMQATYGSPKAAWAEAGQNVSDMAFKNYLQKEQALAQADSELDLQLKMAQIGKLKAETGAIINPLEQDPTNADQPWANKKTQPIGEWRKLPNGRMLFTMTPDSASVLQDDMLGRLRFAVDRALGLNKPPQSMLPKGTNAWRKTGVEGTWEAVFDPSVGQSQNTNKSTKRQDVDELRKKYGR